jgi:hypothetical protein
VPDELWADCELLFSQSLITTTISSNQPATLPRLRGRLRPSFLAVIDTLMGNRSVIVADDARVG